MYYSLIRPEGDKQVILTIVLNRQEADSVCREMLTGDASPSASKLAYRIFQRAADSRATFETETDIHLR